MATDLHNYDFRFLENPVCVLCAVHGPAALTSPGHLLEIHMPKSHPRPTGLKSVC